LAVENAPGEDPADGSGVDLKRLREEVAQIKWFHRIDLGHGVITPGLDDSPSKLKGLHLPADLNGISVLDVGAWDGFFSFEAEHRGASRVLATDSYCWDPHGPFTKRGFQLAHRTLRSHVEDLDCEVLDLSPARVGKFDLVLFLGVLYHMRHPLLALERVCGVTDKLLILETHIDMTSCRRPAMVFYPGGELNNDPTNWWGPNPAAVECMLKDVGFRRVEQFVPEYGSKVRRVFHAWK
jgi:tRNA (mo5U34)-methyltransferase